MNEIGGDVDVARDERVDRAPAAEVLEHVDGLDRGLARPVVRVGLEDDRVRRHVLDDVAAAPDEAARGRHDLAVAGARRDDRERGARDDRGQVSPTPLELHDDPAVAVGGDAERRRIGRGSGEERACALDVGDQRRERRGVAGGEQPLPRPDDVVRGQARAVAERQPVTEREHDLRAAVLDRPRLGQGGPHGERRVDGRQRLEQLAHVRGATRGRRASRGRWTPARPRGSSPRRDSRPRPCGPGRRCRSARAAQGARQRRGRRSPRRAAAAGSRAGALRGTGRMGRRSGRSPPGGLREGGVVPVRIQEALDRDGDSWPSRPHVAIAGEPDEEGNDADPTTHGRSIGGGAGWGRRAANEASLCHTAGGTMLSARPLPW